MTLIQSTAATCAWLLVTLVVLAGPASAQVSFYAELYPQNRSYIHVVVDASALQTNLVIENVTFDVVFFDGQKQTINRQTFSFTDEANPSLTPAAYERFLPHRTQGAEAAIGEQIYYDTRSQGVTFKRIPGPGGRGVFTNRVSARIPEAIRPNLLGPIPLAQAAGSDEFIACPVREARTEITTPLPPPWSNTPQVGRLTGLKIERIGGQNTLVCTYAAYDTSVSIMRAFPAGKTQCTGEGHGFRCR